MLAEQVPSVFVPLVLCGMRVHVYEYFYFGYPGGDYTKRPITVVPALFGSKTM